MAWGPWPDDITTSELVTAAWLTKVSRSFSDVPRARVRRTTGQNISDATFEAISFGTERFDNDTIHESGANDSRLTCKTAGVYLITATIAWDADGTGIRQVQITLNGGAAIVHDSRAPSSGVTNTNQTVTTIWDLAVNDYVECEVRQTSGGTLGVLAIANESPEFGMVKVG